MSQLPKNSAYKSSITFAEDGVTIKEQEISKKTAHFEDQVPFRQARDYGYDIDVEAMNEDDPQAKTHIVKFKQQKLFELTDERKLVISLVLLSSYKQR